MARLPAREYMCRFFTGLGARKRFLVTGGSKLQLGFIGGAATVTIAREDSGVMFNDNVFTDRLLRAVISLLDLRVAPNVVDSFSLGRARMLGYSYALLQPAPISLLKALNTQAVCGGMFTEDYFTQRYYTSYRRRSKILQLRSILPKRAYYSKLFKSYKKDLY